jgi:hypothetical protein
VGFGIGDNKRAPQKLALPMVKRKGKNYNHNIHKIRTTNAIKGATLH